MSSNYPPSPYGDQQGSHLNPYSSPQNAGGQFNNPNLVQAVKGKVIPPAIFLCVAGSLGLLFSIISIGISLMPPAPIDPAAPAWISDFQKSANGPVATIVNVLFCFLNIAIIVGAVQMMRLKIRPMGIVGAILAMINFGNCCCVIGIPAGIWSLIILLQPDVAKAYEANQ